MRFMEKGMHKDIIMFSDKCDDDHHVQKKRVRHVACSLILKVKYDVLGKKALQYMNNFYHTCKNSYTFWLYMCSHHQAGHRTLNNKTTKIQYNKKL
jgi:hypothetical protein